MIMCPSLIQYQIFDTFQIHISRQTRRRGEKEPFRLGQRRQKNPQHRQRMTPRNFSTSCNLFNHRHQGEYFGNWLTIANFISRTAERVICNLFPIGFFFVPQNPFLLWNHAPAGKTVRQMNMKNRDSNWIRGTDSKEMS